MKYIIFIFSAMLLGCTKSMPPLQTMEEAVRIVEECCFEGGAEQYLRYADTSGISRTKLRENGKVIKALLSKPLDRESFDVTVVPFDEYDPYALYRGGAEYVIKMMELNPRVWNVEPSHIIVVQSNDKPEDASLRYSFGIFKNESGWRFTTLYKPDLLPVGGTIEFPLSEKDVVKRRTQTGFEYKESLGSITTPPFRFVSRTVILSSETNRMVTMKSATEDYELYLGFIDDSRDKLIMLYEDQFHQSRAEIFQSTH